MEAAAIVVSSVAVATRQLDSCQRLQQQNKTKQRISPSFCRWQCGWSQRPIRICLVSKTQHHKCWLGNNVSCMHSILKFFKYKVLIMHYFFLEPCNTNSKERQTQGGE